MKQQSNYYFAGDEDDHTSYDVYQLFQYYDAQFFEGQLEKCTVRWTKKMTLCAGTCKYQGFGSSTISLSEPLLKFRTSNQLKQTLIHQMIHAYLFKTNPEACKVDGGHGQAFQQIMHKINKITGLRISVYHSFHNQVNFYRQHVWRCNGRCKDKPPFYGYVKRSMNRPPQPADRWWNQHQRQCGGQYSKISGPEKQNQQKKQPSKLMKNKRKSKKISQEKDHRSWGSGKTIQEYIKQMQNKQKKNTKNKERLKDQKTASRQQSISQCQSQQKITKQFDTFEQNSNKPTSINFLCKKQKTLQQYCKQIQQEKMESKQQRKVKNDADSNLSTQQKSKQIQNNNLNNLLKKYRPQQ